MELANNKAQEKNTLNQKYFYKLSSNIIVIFTGICTSAIVPRALGVNAFGNFSFVNNVITQILSFLDMRASTCFYVKLSQRQSESKIITFYGLYNLLVFGVLILIIIALTFTPLRQYLFENIDRRIIWLSLIFVSAKWVADIFIKVSDAYGTTIIVEKIKMTNQVLAVVVLALLFYFNWIDISVFYIHQILMFSVLVFLIYSFFKRNNYKIPFVAPMEKTTIKQYAKEFYYYSSPLAFFLTTTLITEIFDRYLLQHFGGSFQQGLYGFSFSMSNMTIMFVMAIVPLFTRELSIAFSSGDIALASSLYRKYVPTMYVISAYFCCFLFINAESVIFIFGGSQYKASLIPLKIMLLYPLISTYSNLNASVIYAKSSTTLIRNITIVLTPLGMITAYFLISTEFMNLGATGLAIKVLVVELLSVFTMMFYISSYLNFRVQRYFLHMVFAPVILLLLAFGVKTALLFFFEGDASNIVYLLVAGVLYSGVFGLIFYFFPIFIGLSKDNIKNLENKVKQNFLSRLNRQ